MDHRRPGQSIACGSRCRSVRLSRPAAGIPAQRRAGRCRYAGVAGRPGPQPVGSAAPTGGRGTNEPEGELFRGLRHPSRDAQARGLTAVTLTVIVLAALLCMPVRGRSVFRLLDVQVIIIAILAIGGARLATMAGRRGALEIAVVAGRRQ